MKIPSSDDGVIISACEKCHKFYEKKANARYCVDCWDEMQGKQKLNDRVTIQVYVNGITVHKKYIYLSDYQFGDTIDVFLTMGGALRDGK